MTQPQPTESLAAIDTLWQQLGADYCREDDALLETLLPLCRRDTFTQKKIQSLSLQWSAAIRAEQDQQNQLESLMLEYGLDNAEGIRLMQLAEALVRVPDRESANDLIRSKLKGADWASHLKKNLSTLVNASTRALIWGNHVLQGDRQMPPWLNGLIKEIGEPVVRLAITQAMKLFGSRFVFGESLSEAKERSKNKLCSFDMLGEAALTEADAGLYFEQYLAAINTFSHQQTPSLDYQRRANVSIKLSALHPRYEATQSEHTKAPLLSRLKQLLLEAKQHQVSITFDAEEMDRLEFQLELFQILFEDNLTADWPEFGIAVQAYSKRAMSVLKILHSLAISTGKKVPVRLVKGAYWDSEIKHAQMLGLNHYSVYSQKAATDLSYIACAHYLLQHNDAFYPQFATHNAHSAATILTLCEQYDRDFNTFEFQRLHGMGEALYQKISESYPDIVCRMYAPVGVHQELLPYLIRRLLENGANSSFIYQLANKSIAVENLVRDPLAHYQTQTQVIPLPDQVFLPTRKNASGLNLQLRQTQSTINQTLMPYWSSQWQATSWIDGKPRSTTPTPCYSPYDKKQMIGEFHSGSDADIDEALMLAQSFSRSWQHLPVGKRVPYIQAFAQILEDNRNELIALCVLEAGKTIADSIDEIREAIDFCHYYSEQALALQTKPQTLISITGEENLLWYEARGIVLCISPWNFPLAIFVGQIIAALVTGNVVIAKPAEQTSCMASFIVKLLLSTGLPTSALALILGDGESVGVKLVEDPRVDTIVFTGSNETATDIQKRTLSHPRGILPIIAETGGINVMVVDTTALLEQVVKDVILSAFYSAGQRCSSLRVLLVHQQIANEFETMLSGAMAALVLGDGKDLSTDIGPVIDQDAKQKLMQHKQFLDQHASLIYAVDAEDNATIVDGNFFPPCAYRIKQLDLIEREVFGPILHVMHYQHQDLEKILTDVDRWGYGLTLGIHSRNDENIEFIENHVRSGNIYINRNMVGAVVGAQPFGGMAKSGTGPKAGGPNYLKRFCVERTRCNNTAAMGGNTQLLNSSYQDYFRK